MDAPTQASILEYEQRSPSSAYAAVTEDLYLKPGGFKVMVRVRVRVSARVRVRVSWG